MTPGRIEAVDIAKKNKKILPHCRIVLGGIHPTIMWQQMMQHYSIIDYIIKGEGEITLSELVQNSSLPQIKGLVWRKSFQIINNPSQLLIQHLDQIPFPAWDLIDLQQYPPRGQGVFNGINLEKEIRVPIIFSVAVWVPAPFAPPGKFGEVIVIAAVKMSLEKSLFSPKISRQTLRFSRRYSHG